MELSEYDFLFGRKKVSRNSSRFGRHSLKFLIYPSWLRHFKNLLHNGFLKVFLFFFKLYPGMEPFLISKFGALANNFIHKSRFGKMF